MVFDKNPEKIKTMFDEISQNYDFINNLISLGTHYFIKTLAIKELGIKKNAKVLDICSGSGDFTKIISKLYPAIDITGVDVSEKMLEKAKLKNPGYKFIKGDCTNLGFKDKSFSFVTAGFGLRNIKDRKAAIVEIYRVLDNKGKFLHLDFGSHNFLSKFFDIMLLILTKPLKNSAHYKYLINSKNNFPEPEELIKEFESSGFKHLKTKNYIFGIISAQIMQKD